MLDKVVREKCHDNTDNAAVQDQAMKFLQMFRAGKTHDQTISDSKAQLSGWRERQRVGQPPAARFNYFGFAVLRGLAQEGWSDRNVLPSNICQHWI